MPSTLRAEVPVKRRQQKRPRPRPSKLPRYHVLLWNDDEHTFTYVIHMMRELFGHTLTRAKQIAEQVHTDGAAVCLTTTKEHAELKRDQVHAYGRDRRVVSCVGAMSCTIEPEN